MKARGPSRPKANEDEDDLLAAQESFLRENGQAAAAIARAGPPPKVVMKSSLKEDEKTIGPIPAAPLTKDLGDRRVSCMSLMKHSLT
jgi:hypothetical protein